MNNLRWKIVQHNDITDSDLIAIARLKDQHWTHGIDSQLEWMTRNLERSDFHLFGANTDAELVAYLALVNINLTINDEDCSCSYLGLSNVCVDRNIEKKGMGSKLIFHANEFIKKNNRPGILLCKDSLIPFYTKNGWRVLEYHNAVVGREDYLKNIMIFNCGLTRVNSIFVSKNF